jgi:hypothetical protein
MAINSVNSSASADSYSDYDYTTDAAADANGAGGTRNASSIPKPVSQIIEDILSMMKKRGCHGAKGEGESDDVDGEGESDDVDGEGESDDVDGEGESDDVDGEGESDDVDGEGESDDVDGEGESDDVDGEGESDDVDNEDDGKSGDDEPKLHPHSARDGSGH